MDNHVMYYYDEDGELEMTRCCFCKWVIMSKNNMECSCGHNCAQEECDAYISIGRKKTSWRIGEVKEMRRVGTGLE